MKDLSSSSINWPVPEKPFGGFGSPVAGSGSGSAWSDLATESGDTGEEASGEGSVESS